MIGCAMRYAGIIENDVVNGEGICVSFFTQGCPHRCEGCFNPETWDYEGGHELPENIEDILYDKITANGVRRNFSILGGEPLCLKNQELVDRLTRFVKTRFPQIKIFLWTGYTMEELKRTDLAICNPTLERILDRVDVLITGRFILAERSLMLPLRGSRNQQIWRKNNGIFTLNKEENKC